MSLPVFLVDCVHIHRSSRDDDEALKVGLLQSLQQIIGELPNLFEITRYLGAKQVRLGCLSSSIAKISRTFASCLHIEDEFRGILSRWRTFAA